MTSRDDDEKETIHTELDVTETELINPGLLDDEKSEEIVSDESADTKKAKHILQKLLMTRLPSVVMIFRPPLSADDTKDLASRIIDEVRHYAQSDHKLYCRKMRDIMFNLRHNNDLLKNVLNALLTPKELVSMDIWQMASTELSQQRKWRQEVGKNFDNDSWMLMMNKLMRNAYEEDKIVEEQINEMCEQFHGVDMITEMVANLDFRTLI
eukprot:78745_1